MTYYFKEHSIRGDSDLIVYVSLGVNRGHEIIAVSVQEEKWGTGWQLRFVLW